MALRVSELIVKGVEVATMVCFLAVPAATISVWPVGDRRLRRSRQALPAFRKALYVTIGPPGDAENAETCTKR